MSPFVLCVSLFAAVTQPVSYGQAYSAAQTTRKPMLVLVGADWCPACRVMKQSTLPALQRAGHLDDVSYTIVDVDSDRALGSQLMRSSSIPQLILLMPMSNGWKRYYLHGNQSPDQIVSMIRGGLHEQQADQTAHRASAAADTTADE